LKQHIRSWMKRKCGLLTPRIEQIT